LKKVNVRNKRRQSIAKVVSVSRRRAAGAWGLVGCSTCFNFLKIPATNEMNFRQTETARKPNC
jgi:hypothetical protein